MHRFSSVLIITLLAAACAQDRRPTTETDTAPSRPSLDTAVRAAGTSGRVISIEEALQAFRKGLPEPAGLQGGAASREQLVRQFVAALSTGDTAAFRSMTLSRAEFAYLFYPSHPLARPPYELDAETMWLQQTANSGKGLARLLETYGGQPHRYVSHRCDSAPERQGRNVVWKNCELVMMSRRGRTQASLFGDILQRDGQFAFVSYANRL